MKITGMLWLAVALGWLAGCASPDARIKRSPEVFARLSPEQQAMVQRGEVGIGFDAEAVRLAVGEPDRRWTRTDAKGTVEVWSYVSWETDLGEPLYSGWYHRYAGFAPVYYLNAPARREREYFKVVFDAGGKVSSVEKNERR